MADRHYADAWAAKLVREDRLPARYAEVWAATLDEFGEPCLRPGMTVLDVGPGASPTIPPERRPAGTSYVALDASREELEGAPAGSYDEHVVSDVATRLPSLEGRFDLVVSLQALEHVGSLRAAFDNIHSYLRPGGRMFAVLSGSASFFALLNRLLPLALTRRGMQLLLDRPPETTFRAHYDRCSSREIHQLLEGWSSAEVRPKYAGAGYLVFSRILMRAYLRYENWSLDHPNLATHYLVAAVR